MEICSSIFVGTQFYMQSIFVPPVEKRRRTSDVLISLAKMCRNESITLRVLTEKLGDRTYGILLIVLSATNVIPFVSIISGVLVFIIGVQMVLGFPQVHLPSFIMDWRLPNLKVKNALLLFARKVRSLEGYIHPRWQFTEAPLIDRCNGIIIAILGAIITLPIPFTNIAPGIVVTIMSLGLLERDGMVQVFALVSGVCIIWVIYLLLIT